MSEFLAHLQDINAAMETGTTALVKVWMNWMGLIFMASIFFVWKHWPARIAFLALIATGFAVINIWSQTKNVHLFGVAHILIWGPLAVYLWSQVISSKSRAAAQTHKLYFIWAVLLFLTIVISLIFDVRDIYLVMKDLK